MVAFGAEIRYNPFFQRDREKSDEPKMVNR